MSKIGVLRANAIGDFIVTLPALQAIRAKYPDAEIVLLGAPWHKKFLTAGRTPVDRVIVVPVKEGIRSSVNEAENEEDLKAFFIEMQKEKFDMIINFQGNGVSANPFIKRCKPAYTVGLSGNDAEPLDKMLDFYYYQSEVLRYVEVAALIDARTDDIEPHINVLEQDKEEVKGLLSFLNHKPFAVLHAFATDIRRSWPAQNFIELADWLKEKQYEVLFTGLQQDYETIETLIASMKYTAINGCGALSLGGLSAILQQAKLVVAGDTGPLHLARAVGTPTVGIYWAPNLINWGPLYRSIHKPVISWDLACPYCGIIPNQPYPFEPRTACQHEVSFVRDVPVSAVCEAAASILFKKNSICEKQLRVTVSS